MKVSFVKRENEEKRYSLAVGPPKKDPKVKGVQSAAVQAFLKRKEEELRKKALEEKRKKEELVKKRIELKHDKKARAMAKRTKDNFYGYDGIPIEEKTKRKQLVEEPTGHGADQECFNEEEAESLEYYQTESEHEESEEYEEQEPPLKSVTKPKAPLKSAPPPMNFTDLLRLAEKKQHEPVEIKVVKKIEERPRTAEELREKEFLERKHKNIDRGKEKKLLGGEKRPAPSTMSKKVPSPKECVSARHKGPGDKHSSSRGSHLPQIGAEKKSRPLASSEKSMRLPSTKSQPGERTKAGSGDGVQHSTSESHNLLLNGAEKSRSNSHTMGTGISKTMIRGTQKSNEHRSLKSPSSYPSHSKSGAVSTSHDKTRNPGAKQPGNSSSSTSGRPGNSSSSTSGRPGNSSSSTSGRPGNSSNSTSGRPGSSSSSTSGRPGIGTSRAIQSPSPKRHGGSSSSGPEQQANGSKRLISSSGPTGRPISVSGGREHPTSNLGSSGRLASSSGPTGRTMTQLGRSVSSSSGPGRPSSGAPGRPVSGSGTPGRPISGSGGPGRPISGSGGPGRPASSSGGPGRPISGSGRPVSGSGGPGRPVSGSGSSGRPMSSGGSGRTVSASGPAMKPRCTVVSETISSKNISSRPSNGMVNGLRSPPPGFRPAIYSQGTQRSPFPPMARKRYHEEDEEEEYDSEMDDFIDDEGEPQEEISKHIREIFGYDRNKYKDESDYALRYMESSWREQQKEEAKSLRLGMQEDLEEMRREEEELKRRKVKKMKLR
ncbi:protein SPT2 homolog isoform X2 [Macrotis lagotis]|uniref:protein SPT2 homolog isoform X2 n=1 Tax=Macrotis lagotis TaxID=92651 RepID=UPI003D699F4E